MQGHPHVTPLREWELEVMVADVGPDRSQATTGVDVATPPRPMAIVATTDDVSRTPSPHTTLADKRLKPFTQ